MKITNYKLQITKAHVWNLALGIWNFHPRRANGFTLIEAVVAFGLIMVTVMGPVTLITRGLVSIAASKNKLVAVNLAQEGIEIIRLVRENNVLCDSLNGGNTRNWTDNPSANPVASMDSSAGYRIDANVISSPGGYCTPPSGPITSIPMPVLNASSCSSQVLNIDANGVYTYGAGTPTMYRRCVFVCTPPAVGKPCAAAPDADLAGREGDQMDIVSEVYWTDRGNPRSLRLRDRLYNWR